MEKRFALLHRAIIRRIQGSFELRLRPFSAQVTKENQVKFTKPWSADEDRRLLIWLSEHDKFDWSGASLLVRTRSPIECRRRYFALCLHLEESKEFDKTDLDATKFMAIRKWRWSEEEDKLLVQWLNANNGSTKNIEELSQKLQRTHAAIWARMRHLDTDESNKLTSKTVTGRGGYLFLDKKHDIDGLLEKVRALVSKYGTNDWERVTQEANKNNSAKIALQECQKIWRHVPVHQRYEYWSPREDAILMSVLKKKDRSVWGSVDFFLPGRLKNEILLRAWKITGTGPRKGVWTATERANFIKQCNSILTEKWNLGKINSTFMIEEVSGSRKMELFEEYDWFFLALEAGRGIGICKNYMIKFLQEINHETSVEKKDKVELDDILVPNIKKIITPKVGPKKMSALWTDAEVEIGLKLLEKHGTDWQTIAKELQNQGYYRSPNSCERKLNRTRIPALSEKKWTVQEDAILLECIYHCPLSESWLEKIAEKLPQKLLVRNIGPLMRLNDLMGKGSGGKWSPLEVQRFTRAIVKFYQPISGIIDIKTMKGWTRLSFEVRTRSPQQCRMYFMINELNLIEAIKEKFENNVEDTEKIDLSPWEQNMMIRLIDWIRINGKDFTKLAEELRQIPFRQRRSWWATWEDQDSDSEKAKYIDPDPMVAEKYQLQASRGSMFSDRWDDIETAKLIRLRHMHPKMTLSVMAKTYFPTRNRHHLKNKLASLSDTIKNPPPERWPDADLERLRQVKKERAGVPWSLVARMFPGRTWEECKSQWVWCVLFENGQIDNV